MTTIACTLLPVDAAGDASVVFGQAVALHQQGLLSQARSLYEQALAKRADYFEAEHLLGILCLQSKLPDEALLHLDRAIALRPEAAFAHNNRGLVLQQLHRHDEAVTSFDQSVALQPDYMEACYNRGNSLDALSRFAEAAASYERAIELAPGFADAHYNRGNALQKLQRFDEALASYDRAIALRADFAAAWNNRGNALQATGQIELALRSYEHAIAQNPDDAEPRCNRGIALQALLRSEEALASYDQAISLDPEHANAHWNKSLSLLLNGQFEQGLPLYEWRWKVAQSAPERGIAEPQWRGQEPIAGKTILLHAEQGFGDSIQFSRYARLVSERGARVVLEVQSSLVGLLAGLEGVSQVVGRGEALPAFDCHCPLLSLPLAFGTTVDRIPSPGPYLRCPPDRLASWRERLGVQTRPRIGLAWSGGQVEVNHRKRSVDLAALLAHLPPGCEYVSLQKDVRATDRAVLERSQVWHFTDDLKDFTDTAALCELVNIVVTVDTSVAHLAGALGRPAWILLPFAPDWRWLLDRDDSPWYESVRLYRQADDRRWDPVLERVAADLRADGRLL